MNRTNSVSSIISQVKCQGYTVFKINKHIINYDAVYIDTKSFYTIDLTRCTDYDRYLKIWKLIYI